MSCSRVLACLAAAAALLLPAAALSQVPYPARPVRIVVPFDPGSGPDILARTIGHKLSEKWGVAVTAENRSGASSAVGTETVVRAAPDGYTLMVTANTLVLNRALRGGTTSYDPVKDLAPVAPLAIGQLTLVANPALSVSSVQALVAAARAKPGSIDYGSPGVGTPHHLTMEMFKQALGISLTHIPYSSTGGAVQDLIGGRTDVMFLPIHVALPHVQARRLVLLASGGQKRAAVTPDAPSLAEASEVRDIDCDIWYGMYVPAGTPAAIVARLNADVNAVLGAPDLQATLSRQGLETTGGTAQALARTTREDLARWSAVVRAARIRAE